MRDQAPTGGAGSTGTTAASSTSYQQPPALHQGDFGADPVASRTRRLNRRRLDSQTEFDAPADIAASERALGNLLTVIKAEAQLLERAVRRADRYQPERTGVRLAAIVTMVDEAAVELFRLSRLRAQAAKRQ